MDMNNKYYETTDMRIVPQGSSSTNFKHLRVPQNSVIRGWEVVYFEAKPNFFSRILLKSGQHGNMLHNL